MAKTAAEHRHAVRARRRAAAMERIADRLTDGTLAKLPDLFLRLIEHALNRDLQSIAEIALPPRTVHPQS